MELIFFDLPNEVNDIITNCIRKINMAYFHNKGIDFNDLLCLIKTSNCALTCEFTDNYRFIYDSVTVYGKCETSRNSMHSFSRNIVRINLPKDYVWSIWYGNLPYNMENLRYYNLKTGHERRDALVLRIKFQLMRAPYEYVRSINNKNIMVIEN